MSDEISERTYLDTVVLPQLRAQGFEVFIEPRGSALPEFLQGTSPDAIAVRNDKKYVIEVSREGVTRKGTEALRARVLNQPGWELRFYLVTTAGDRTEVRVVTHVALENTLDNVKHLIAADQTKPALLIAWAMLEGLGRSYYPSELARPQTPARVVETLASRGNISQEQAELLRELASCRNQLIHGQVDLDVRKDDMNKFVDVLSSLLRSRASETAQSPP